MDDEQGQYQNLMNDSTVYHADLYFYQQAQQWQQERLELRQDLTLICQYLRSLAERQEQLWVQIHLNHEQNISECRQNFQNLSNLIINTVEPQANSRQILHMKESELKQEVTETNSDESMSAYLKLLKQHPKNNNLQDNASEQTYSIGSQDKLNSSECNVTTNVKSNIVGMTGGEESREMTEKYKKEQNMQYYPPKKGLADPDHDWKMETPDVWHVTGRSEISGISDNQKHRLKAAHKPDTQLLGTKGRDEEHNMKSKYKNVSETHDDILEPLHPLQNLPVTGPKSEQKDKTNYLDGLNKPWDENEQKGKSQNFNVQDKHLENTKGSKEQTRLLDQKLSHKLYADAVLADQTTSTKLKINHSSEENIVDKLTFQFDTTDLPQSQESFAGTGFYAEAISKLLNNRTPSPVGSVQSNASSNGRMYYRNARKDSNQSETTDSKTFSTSLNSKKNIEIFQKKVPVENIYESGADFQIGRSREFSVSNKVYMSPYIYANSKACKVRVCVYFNKAGYLNISIRVARDAIYDEHKWPILLSGNGLILHNGSKLFTPIWQLQPSTCRMPTSENEEVILKPVVCLSSSRNMFSNITYKDLEKMQFAGNNCLTFKWNLKVGNR